MRRIVALVLSLAVFLGGANCMAENVNFSGGGVTSPIELVDGLFVGIDGDLQPGWYSAIPSSEGTSKLTIVDVESFDRPVIVASYSWWPEGTSLLSDCDDDPEQYVFPLWEGCFILAGYFCGLEFDKANGELSWERIDDAPAIGLEYVAPLAELPAPGTVEDDSPAADDPLLLYEDERVSIRYSDFRVETYGEHSFLKIEWLIENKTDEIVDVTCKTITVNGCAVHISKFVDVPPRCKYLHEWTEGAELYLKYGIGDVESFSAVIDIDNGADIVTEAIHAK